MTIRARLLAWIAQRAFFTRSEAVRRFSSIKPGTIDYYLSSLVAADYLHSEQVINTGEASCWQYRIYTPTGKPLDAFRFRCGRHRRAHHADV